MNLKSATSILLLCSFIILVIALTGCNYTKEYLEQIDYSSLKGQISDKNDFILYIGNKSCSHCKNFEPKFRNVINEYKISAYKLDTATMTTDEYKEFVGLIGEISTPKVLFFYDGEESGTANRINGDVSKEDVISKLKANDYIKDWE